jgi:integrase
VSKHNTTTHLQSLALTTTTTKSNRRRPDTVKARDGEVVIYKRERSLQYQCRYKDENGTWVRVSTQEVSLERAIAAACRLYDQARFRQAQGLAQKAHTFAHIAQAYVKVLETEIGKQWREESKKPYARRLARQGIQRRQTALDAYLVCVRDYFLPYFKQRPIDEITQDDMAAFEYWRDKRRQRTLVASTQQNYITAWNRLMAFAVEKGYLPAYYRHPRLKHRGRKSTPRPAFTEEEIERLLAFMAAWRDSPQRFPEQETRPLCCDYVEMLLLTGMRHSTEAYYIRWKHLAWHWDKGVRYLRIWVSGKTGPRWLIAKHRAVDVLRRLHARQQDISDIPFDALFEQQLDLRVFRASDGTTYTRMDSTWNNLMRDSGLLKSATGERRSLYSLRHTYATLALMRNEVDIHTLSKQLGNSVAMIERYYSKLTATMAAERLA